MKRIILCLLLIFFYTNISIAESEKWKESNSYLCFGKVDSSEKKPQFFLFFPPDKKILLFVPFRQDYQQRLLNIIVNNETNLIATLGDTIGGEGMQMHLNKETNKLSWTIKGKNQQALRPIVLECVYKP